MNATPYSPIDPSAPLAATAASAVAASAGGRGGPTDPSHDVELRRGILHTEVARPVAAVLAAGFLAAIVAVPVGQAVADRLKGEESVLPDLFRRAPCASSRRIWPKRRTRATGCGRACRRC
jgi:hypothetical protein